MHSLRTIVPFLVAMIVVPAWAVLSPDTELAAVRLDQEVTALYGVVVAAEDDQDGGFRARERAAMSQIEEMMLNARSLVGEIRGQLGQPATTVLPARIRLEGNGNQLGSAERDLRNSVPGIPLNMMRVEGALQELLAALDVADAPREEAKVQEPKQVAEAPPVDWGLVDEAVVRMNAAVSQLRELTADNPKFQKRVGGSSIEQHFQGMFAAAEQAAVAVENRENNIAEATRKLSSLYRRLNRFSRGTLDKAGSARLKSIGDDLAVLERYFQ